MSNPLLETFLRARYTIDLPDGRASLVIGTTCAALGTLAPAGTPFAVLTAWNPGGSAAEPASNEAAQRGLETRLGALARDACRGLRQYAGWNDDANGGWREPTRLVIGLTAAHADALARRFGQAAILAGRIGEPVRLRWYGAVPRAPGVDTAFVEWVASRPAPDPPS